MDKDQVCCSVCGSLRVQYAVWHNPNTGEVGDEFGSWNAGDNTFCADCDMEGRDPNPNLIAACADPKAFKQARAKRVKQERREAVNLAKLVVLRKKYHEYIDAMIKQYPGQKVNEDMMRACADKAHLGIIQRKIKGSLSEYRRGDEVLVWEDGDPAEPPRTPTVKVWHPRNNIESLVETDAVKEIE